MPGYAGNLDLFQSTHPVRGATLAASDADRYLEFQSTHPVRGATVLQGAYPPLLCDFNPRTP